MTSSRALRAALFAGAVAFASADVTVLTPDNFDDFVGKDKPVFVEYYAPWCGHCKALAPVWDELGATFKPSDGVVIAKVDADAHKDLASKAAVTGFPTLKYYPAKSTTPEDYSGGRGADELVAFVNGKTGLARKIKVAPTAVAALTSADFDAVAGDPSRHRLLEFYAPWCGHCKALAPVYEKLGAAFEGEPSVLIAKIDADKHRDLGERFGVKGFPTLKFVPAGAKLEDAEDYAGGRELDDFVSFINGRAGTARKADGTLTDDAGRVDVMDAHAAAFMMANEGAARANKLKAAEEDAATATGAAGAHAKVYLAVMKKVVEKGAGYVAKEAERVAGMLKSASIAPAKRTELQIKANVLKAFV